MSSESYTPGTPATDFRSARIEWAASRLAAAVLAGVTGWPIRAKARTLAFVIAHGGRLPSEL